MEDSLVSERIHTDSDEKDETTMRGGIGEMRGSGCTQVYVPHRLQRAVTIAVTSAASVSATRSR